MVTYRVEAKCQVNRDPTVQLVTFPKVQSNEGLDGVRKASITELQDRGFTVLATKVEVIQ